ncbi:hypothetical protein BH23PLA1_BH23PLA1_26460 [soil metagenome]
MKLHCSLSILAATAMLGFFASTASAQSKQMPMGQAPGKGMPHAGAPQTPHKGMPHVGGAPQAPGKMHPHPQAPHKTSPQVYGGAPQMPAKSAPQG